MHLIRVVLLLYIIYRIYRSNYNRLILIHLASISKKES